MEGLLSSEANLYENSSLHKQKLRQFHIQSQYVLDELMKVSRYYIIKF